MFLLCLSTNPFTTLNNLKKPTYAVDIEAHRGKFTSILEENSTSQFILELHNGVVVNEGGAITEDGHILQDTQTFGSDQQKLTKKNRNINDENPEYFNGKLAIISSPGAENWYHWLLQVLPRLIILKESNLSYDQIYINNLKFLWQQDSLEIVLNFLNIDEKKILSIDGDSIIQANTLIVPSVPFIPAKGQIIPNWLKENIQDIFLKTSYSTIKPHDKIYISRAEATGRRITNEKDFTKQLEKDGFKILIAEKLSIYDQAKIFNHAKIIITPHGSGLANLIFIQPNNTRVIEIDYDLERGDLYENICKMMLCSSYKKFYADEAIANASNEDMILSNIPEFLEIVGATE
jgi:capsular polysaccharide biosynthesis protein